jgi:putative Ca2+/H+ antiporter (TMEM165/GDT1 family)
MAVVTFPTAAAIAFGVIALVELPDKTLVATLVLSTRYRPRPVLVGVAAAFAVQCAIAAAAGGVITLLPRRVVEAVVAALFAVGALLLIRESFQSARAHADDVELAEQREPAGFGRIVLTASSVLFAAEWGDASQIATAGLVARPRGVEHAVATAVGAWVALVAVAVLATVVGKLVVRRVPLHLVHRVAGMLFAVFAGIALAAAVRG